MGMDIYAGTLTRYFSKDWKTAAQVYAEEKGLAFQTIYSQGQEESTSQQEIMEWVCRWRDSLTAALSEALDTELLAWEESGAKEYRTNKPDWDAFGALLLYEACQLLNEPLPESVHKKWNWSAHPLISRAAGGCPNHP